MSFSQFLAIIRARWLLVGGVFLAVVVSAIAVSLVLPKKYQAWTSLVVDIRASDPISGGGIPVQLIPGYMATQAEIINSERVARRVVEVLELEKIAEFREAWLEETEAKTDFTIWLATLLKKSLEVRPSRENNIIGISFASTSPEFASSAANAFADAYMQVLLELKVEPARQYADWFRQQSAQLRTELEAAQRKLSDYQREHGLVLMGGQLDVESAKLAELTRQLAIAQGQLVESSSRAADAGSADTLPEVMQSSLIAGLKGDLARLESQYKQSLMRLGNNHPEVTRLATEMTSIKARISAEIARVVGALNASSRISVTRQEELAIAVEAQKDKVLALNAHVNMATLLQRDVDSANRAYEQIGQRLSQLSLESQNQLTNVAVLTKATPPYKPSSPRILVNVFLAVIFGIAFGITAAVLLEVLSPHVRTPDDMQRINAGTLIVSVNWGQDYEPAGGKAVSSKKQRVA